MTSISGDQRVKLIAGGEGQDDRTRDVRCVHGCHPRIDLAWGLGVVMGVEIDRRVTGFAHLGLGHVVDRDRTVVLELDLVGRRRRRIAGAEA